ncbi:MAG TPA: S-methyl-5-thioribose-1-phosphate isomerase, partial [Thermoprotei archaeon]|nr:S-methyl-5-thioribose-1-phosphate isomerase [Thermoprotei archaeon]
QLKLPYELEYIETRNYKRIARAIREMEIRGAPAIGVAAAYGLALAVTDIKTKNLNIALRRLKKAAEVIGKTRPTAVNLFWAINRILSVAEKARSVEELKSIVINEAIKIGKEDEECNLKIGEIGSQLIEDGYTIITICNAGSLATSYYGTATAPIYYAYSLGKRVNVIAFETRPYLQGARLTAFELNLAGIPVKIATDNMMGIILEKMKIDLIIVGADRITKDGYVVNKIGTYPLALLAREHNVPFYVAAPTSTIDMNSSIKNVKIERRPDKEVLYIFGKRIAPEGVGAIYYAFDITPPKLVEGIITERGIIERPIEKNLALVMK